jgi:GDP-mannose 6-dehydrogenase
MWLSVHYSIRATYVGPEATVLRCVFRMSSTDLAFTSFRRPPHRNFMNIKDQRMKISVFGLGYVGAVSVGCLAKDGHSVIGIDPNPTKVDMINAGQSPIVESEIGDIIAKGVASGLIEATTDPVQAVNDTDLSLVCVGTPSNANGSLDLRYVRSVCQEIGIALGNKERRHTVVIRSTMLPGTMREVVIPLLEEHSGKRAGKDFGVCNNPEFLREGTAVYDYYHPPKTVIGELEQGDGDLLCTLYESMDAPLIRAPVDIAEMVKYVDNVWHALKVGFANEIGNICKEVGLDGQEVMSIFCQDHKLNLSSYYMKPGFAFGGSCLPKDLRALNFKAGRLDLSTPILSSIQPSNALQIQRGFDLVKAKGSKRVGILGFSFKAGTDDLRESPVVELIERLLGKGFEVSIYDKNVNVARLMGANREYILNHIPHIAKIMVGSVAEVLAGADTIVVGNGSDEFRDIVSQLNPDQCVIDFVGVAKPPQPSDQYDGIGW